MAEDLDIAPEDQPPLDPLPPLLPEDENLPDVELSAGRKVIDDDTAARYYEQLDTPDEPESEKEMRRKALREWADEKSYEEMLAQEEDIESAYTDTATWWNETQGGDNVPEETKQEIANRKYLRSIFNTPDAVNDYGFYRERWSHDNLARTGLSETELFNEIKTRVTAKRDVRSAVTGIPGDVAVALFQNAESGQPVNLPKLFEDWKRRNEPTIGKLRDADSRRYLKAAEKWYVETDAALRDYGPQLQKLYGHFLNVTGAGAAGRGESKPGEPMTMADEALAKAPKDYRDLEGMVDALADMPAKTRQRAYSAVVLGARQLGLDEKSFLEKWGDAWSRTIDQFRYGGINEAASKNYRLKQLLASGSVLITTPEGKEPAYGDLYDPGANLGVPEGPEFSSNDDLRNARPATKEEIAILKKLADKEGRKIQVSRELLSVANEQFDPNTRTESGIAGFFEEMALGSPQAITYTAQAALPGVGGYLVFNSLYNMSLNELALEHPDAPLSVLETMAATQAFGEAIYERASALFLLGKFKPFERLLKKYANFSRFGVGSRYLIRSAVGVAGEQPVEAAQDFLKPQIQDVAAALTDSIPNVNWEKYMTQFWDTRMDVLAATIPGVLLFGAGGALADAQGYQDYESRRDLYLSMGRSEEQIREIEDEPTIEGKDKILKRQLDNVTAEEVARSKAYHEQKKQEAGEQLLAPGEPKMEAVRNPDGSVTYVIRDGDGQLSLKTSNEQDALDALSMLRREAITSMVTEQTRGISEALSFFSEYNDRIGRGEDVQKFLIENAPRSLLDDYNKNPTLETFQRLKDTLKYFGRDVNEPAELAKYWVAASNSGALAEGVYRSVIRVTQQADGKAIFRDVAQDNLKRAVAEGAITLEWVKEQLDKVLPLIESARVSQKLKTDSDTAVIEAFSDLAFAYAVGRVKEDQIPPGLRGFMRRVAAIVKDIYRRAYNLMRLRDAGQLDANFEALLAESVGLSAQSRVDVARDRATEQMAPTTGLEQTLFNYTIAGTGQKIAGVHVNDSTQNFTADILAGRKTIETRKGWQSLWPYRGQRIGLVRTGKGKGMLVGYATLATEPKLYATEEEWLADQDRHRVDPANKEYAWTPAGRYGWELTDVVQVEPQEVEFTGNRVMRPVPGEAYMVATDDEYLAAVERGDMETAQRMVDEAAKRAGFDIGPVWHGGADGFDVFDWSRIGQQGTTEGKGFYFSNDRDLAAGYASRHGGRLLKVYLRSGKPIDGKKQTITPNNWRRILSLVHSESESAEEGVSPLYNYGDIQSDGLENVIDEAVANITQTSESDVDAIAGFINGGADPQITYDAIYQVTGKTGIVESEAWGREGHTIQIATSANHVKLADPVTYDAQGNVIPLSQRFDATSPNINYSIVSPREEAEYFKFAKQYEETGSPIAYEFMLEMVEGWADKMGYNIGPVYHWSPSKFRWFDLSEGNEGHHFGSEAAAQARADFKKRAKDTGEGFMYRVFLGGKNSTLIGMPDLFTNEASAILHHMDMRGLLKDKINPSRVFDADTKKWAMRAIERIDNELNFDKPVEPVRNSLLRERERHEKRLAQIAKLTESDGATLADPLEELTQMLKVEDPNQVIFWYRNSSEDVGSTSYMVVNAGLIKSGEAITYDENDQIIPPSRRFNPYIPDINYSLFSMDALGPSAASMETDSNEDEQTNPKITTQADIPESVDEVATLESAIRVATGTTFKKGRDLKFAIQNAVTQRAAEAGIDVSVNSPQTTKYLIRVALKDALAALKTNANAIGWYDKKTRQALGIMALVHPEVATDENAKFAFVFAMAVTSNGQKVDKNFDYAEQVYRAYKKTGQMPTNGVYGQTTDAINNALATFNELSSSWGIDNFRKFMLTNFKVAEIAALGGNDLKPGGEHSNVEVRGAAIIGPKIGNGFFSNLYGYFDALTMDRWLIRTWGRWTGTLLIIDEQQNQRARQRLSVAISEMANNAEELKRVNDILGVDIQQTPVDDLAVVLQKKSTKPETRALLSNDPETGGTGTALSNEVRKAGNSLAKYLDGQKEAPSGSPGFGSGPWERKYIREVFSGVLAELQAMPEYKDLTMADLQAVLWYAEKRLYEEAKVESRDDLKSEGYEDDEAPDYANAAAKLAREKGVAQKRINAILEGSTDDSAGDARLAEDSSAQAPGDSEQGPARGFTQAEKEFFVGSVATRRVRMGRADNAGLWSYQRRSDGDGSKPRTLNKLGKVKYTAEWKAGRSLGRIFRNNQQIAPRYVEVVSDQENAAKFHAFLKQAQDASAYGSMINVGAVEDYVGATILLAENGLSGAAVSPGGNIISIFSREAGGARAAMEVALAAGGRRYETIDGVLPHYFSDSGFVSVARIKGDPDRVFMAYDPTAFGFYDRTEGEYVESPEQAVQLQENYSIISQEELDRVNAALTGRNRGPEARIKIYENARARLMGLMKDNREMTMALRAAEVPDPAPALEQIEQRYASELADLNADEEQAIAEAKKANTEKFMAEADPALFGLDGNLVERKNLERRARDRARILEQGIRAEYKQRRLRLEEQIANEKDQVNQQDKAARNAADLKLRGTIRQRKLLDAIGELDALLSALPPEVAGKVGGFSTLSRIGTGDKTLANFFVDRIEMIDKELERVLVREYREALKVLFDNARSSRKQSGQTTSTLGAEGAAFVRKAYAASLLTDTEATGRMEEIQGRLEGESDQTKIRDLVDEWAILNLFGGMAAQDSYKLATALEELKRVVKNSREGWRLQQQARQQEIQGKTEKVLATLGRYTTEARDQRRNKAEFGRIIKELYNSHLAPFQLLEKILGEDHPIAREFSDKIRRASNEQNMLDIQVRREFDNAARVALGYKPDERGVKIRWQIDKAMSALLERKAGVRIFNGRKVKQVKIDIDLAEGLVRGDFKPNASKRKVTDALASLELQEQDVVMTGDMLPALTKNQMETIRRELELFLDRNVKQPRSNPKYISFDLILEEGVLGPRTMNAWEAMQWLAVWRQPDGRGHMERIGYTEESVRQMEKLVETPFAQAMFEEMTRQYAAGYDRHNRVYRKLFGVDMPRNPFYAPFVFINEGQDNQPLMPGERTGSGGMMPGHIKARTRHNAEMEQVNMAEQFWKHFRTGNYWIAWAESVRDMRSVLLNKEVIRSIEVVHGPAVAGAVRDMVKLFTDGGVVVQNRALEGFFNNIAQAVSATTLGFRLSSVINQIDAGMRFMTRLNKTQQRQAFRALFSRQFAAKYARIWNSDSVQIRLEKGSNPLVRMLRENKDRLPAKTRVVDFGRMGNYAIEAGYWPMQNFDAALTSFSGAVIYEAAFIKAKEAGLSDEQADLAAAEEADRVIFETAQPADMAQRSLVENMGNGILKGLMMFMSDQRLKFAMWGRAYEKLIKGESRNDQIRVIAALGFMAMLGELVRALYRDWFTDDDDDEIWNAANFARAFAIGPINGFFLVGTIIDSLVRPIIGEPTFGAGGPIDRLSKDASRLAKDPLALINFDDTEKTKKTWQAAARVAGSIRIEAAFPALLINLFDPAFGLYGELTTNDEGASKKGKRRAPKIPK